MRGAGTTRSKPWTRGIVWTLALGWLALTLLPLALVVSPSLKSKQDSFEKPVGALPSHLDWSHYASVLQGGFFTYLRNSAFVVGTSVVLIVLIAALAGRGRAGREGPFGQAFLIGREA